jgi:hypothetical protein
MIAVRVIITEKTDAPPGITHPIKSPAGQVTIPFPIHNRFVLQPGVGVETDTGMIGT